MKKTIVLLILSLAINSAFAWEWEWDEQQSISNPSGLLFNGFDNDNDIMHAFGNGGGNDEDDLNVGGDANDKDEDANDIIAPLGNGTYIMLLLTLFYIGIGLRKRLTTESN
jgi:hypothetical protein